MSLYLTLIEEIPVKLESDYIEDIDDFDIFQNAYIWHNDGHSW